MSNNPEYNLPKDAYVNFDATSLKNFMIEQLNNSGKFTDQNYEGSNMSSILNILAYYTHVLLFYLNQTSSESTFSQSSIYENMNRIVKLIGYKPTGRQTSLTPVNCTASAVLTPGNYLIKKYSYFLVDNIQYTFKDDQFFEKVSSDVENIESISNNSILYQGTVGEYPTYTAEGLEYETFPIVVDNIVDSNDQRFISHGTISVYVKESVNDTWKEYNEVDTLFLSKPTDRVYDLRLNENGHYEVKFGNGIFGKMLDEGDEVAVFYILSDGVPGQISKNSINGNKLFLYNNATFNELYDQVNVDDISTLIDENNKSTLTFVNPTNSTDINLEESVDDIRVNAPTFLSSQIRLVTESEYEKFLKKTIPNIVKDVKVVNNNRYINEYIQYFYDICVDPNKVNRVIINQVNFTDACDFNNINVFCVPTLSLGEEVYPNFLNETFKNLIRSVTQDKKIITNEVVPRDPIYIAVDFGFTIGQISEDVYKDTELVIYRDNTNRTNKETIKQKVLNAIKSYFDPSNMTLGPTIDISQLTSTILGIDGVKAIKTINKAEGSSFEGLSFVAWNPMFEGSDITMINQTKTLPFFKYPYIYRQNTIVNRIKVLDFNE